MRNNISLIESIRVGGSILSKKTTHEKKKSTFMAGCLEEMMCILLMYIVNEKNKSNDVDRLCRPFGESAFAFVDIP